MSSARETGFDGLRFEKGSFDKLASNQAAYVDGVRGVFVANPSEETRKDMDERILSEDAFSTFAALSAKESVAAQRYGFGSLPVSVGGSATQIEQVQKVSAFDDDVHLLGWNFFRSP